MKKFKLGRMPIDSDSTSADSTDYVDPTPPDK